jgi:hypothetical protein
MLAGDLMPTKSQALWHGCNTVHDEICFPDGEYSKEPNGLGRAKPYPLYDSTTVQSYTVLEKWSPVRSGVSRFRRVCSRGIPGLN